MGAMHQVEPGVIAHLMGVKGQPGKRLVSLNIIEGTPHLFTQETLGEFVPKIDGGRCRTEWADKCLMPVSELPDIIRTRYRLDGIDYVTFTIRPSSFFKSEPSRIW